MKVKRTVTLEEGTEWLVVAIDPAVVEPTGMAIAVVTRDEHGKHHATLLPPEHVTLQIPGRRQERTCVCARDGGPFLAPESIRSTPPRCQRCGGLAQIAGSESTQ